MNGSTSRNHRLLATLLLVVPMVLMMPGASTAADSGAPMKAVYHVDDSSRATAALRNVANHLKAMPQTKIVVVALADGVDFLLSDAKDARGNPYEPMIDDLVSVGVEFRVCNNTLSGRKIEKSRLHPEASIVDSGVAEITRLQAAEGFAYLKP